ncbi:MAG TPA: hypothetical protein VHG89_04860 [Verrucomicrobiae bacterium]|nr:hypothetical protein [Verrucomicrobiae bacterium]
MNQDQFFSLIRSLLKVIGAALAAHGLAQAAGIVNSEDFIGFVLVVAGLVWSHFTHSTADSPPNNSGSTTALLLLLLLPVLFLANGCSSLSSNAYTTELAAASTSDAAMRGYAAYWNQAAQNPAAYHRTLDGLQSERAAVEDASIKVGASIELVEDLRESYATNSAVKPQLQAAITSLADNAGNIVTYINSLMTVTNFISITNTNN